MFTNYLKVTLQNLLGNKLFSCINILGLGIGFTCFILIALFVRDELSYDRHYANAERIYRLSRDLRLNDGSPDFHLAANGPLEAALFKQDFPRIEEVARLRTWEAPVSRGKLFSREEAVFADNAVFSIFDFEWLEGLAANALEEPNSVVLTASLAEKYFAGEDPLGQTLMLEGRVPVQVTGVIGDLPHNTHLRFGMLISMPTVAPILGRNALENPSMGFYHTYALLREGADIEAIESQAPAFYDRHYQAGASETIGLTAMPLTDIHLHSAREGEITPPGSITTVYAFSLIAAVILLIACFNFMNLATAQATRRGKEVGIRKALGARRGQMMGRFLGESLLMSAFAMAAAIAFVELLLPSFNAFVQKDIVFDYGGNGTWPLLLLTTLLVGLLAGSYPALYLSAFNPARVLRDKASSGTAALKLRNVLVILQFTIAIVLLVSTATVFLQIRFARNIELGYDKDRIVVLNSAGREGLGRQWDALKQRLLAHPEISAVTASNFVPGSRVGSNYFIRLDGEAVDRSMPVMLVDHGFFDTYGIGLVAGRFFPATPPADDGATPTERRARRQGAYILNELAARQLGWTPEEAIGQSFEVTCCSFGRGTVVGVVRDVYFESLQAPQAPTVYLIPPEPGAIIHAETRLGLKQASIRLSGREIPETLGYIRETWSDFFPGTPADLRFLQEDFDRLYLREERQNQMLLWFTGLAIFIACLGLYGLASFNAERRTREIGVRKVMGGSVWSIVLLLTNDFSKLVLIANVIAWPVAYFAMNRWLENFAYRIDLAPLIFIGSGLIALCIAWVTVGGTAAKAASAKPVLALRYE